MNRVLVLSFAYLLGGVLPAAAQDQPVDQKPEVYKVAIAVLKVSTPADKKEFVIKIGDQAEKIAFQQETARLTGKLITALAKTNKFNLVEREKMEAVFREMELSDEGMQAGEISQKVGRLMNAQFLLQGTLSTLQANVVDAKIPHTESFHRRITQGRVAVEVRLIDTQTGKIVAAESATEVAKRTRIYRAGSSDAASAQVSEVLEEAQQRAVQRLVAKIMDGAYPIKVVSASENTVFVNRGGDGTVRKGDLLQVVRRGKELRDPDTNALLGYEDTPLALIEIVAVEAKVSKARVLRRFGAEGAIEAGNFCKRVEKPKQAPRPTPRKNPFGD